MTGDTPSTPDPISVMRSRRFLVLLVLAGIVGVGASFAAWCFLELIHQAEDVVYTDLPDALRFDSTPIWWSLPVLAIAGLVVAFAIVRLPGGGGHIPAHGLNPSPTQPVDLPGVVLAAVAGIGLGAVVGPEAPLIALGGGLGFFAIRRLRGDAPPETQAVVAACGTFAAISFLFGSPLIAAVILIEATGLGGPRRSLILIPGLLAAGIGTLVSLGLGSWTGVDTSDVSLTFPDLPDFARPDLVDFLWTIPLAAAIAVGTVVIFRMARATEPVASGRPFVIVPAAGLIVGGLAIAFSEITDKGVNHVLFSGENALTPLVNHADDWSLGALALLIGCKGIAYALSLGSFRGGPAFPAMFLGAAAALMAAQLPGFETTPAVAVGLGAGVAAALRLPLSAIVLATLMTGQSGFGAAPLIIVGVV
ncbi:MAG TPA: chloride channel protein, partial [Solirubrobacterales bacterium]|nr:chloride channel protein [Solirubrobacterales bacterium]